MNLTLTQAFHRTQTLSGELKAAESALTDCEDDAKAKERIASIAAEAVEKAKANLAALKQERDELADHMAALVRQTGDAPVTIAENANEGEQGRVYTPDNGFPDYAPEPFAADHMAALVRQTGDAPVAEPVVDVPGPISAWVTDKPCGQDADAEMFPAEHWPDGGGVSEPFADFGHPTQNGLDQGVNEALDRARSV